ncbi:MAG: hypothetical protein JRC86_05960 [Deltaproteobacteria bacterium]|nr:hypothetical protein [Deltaproteobacteria bacterium]
MSAESDFIQDTIDQLRQELKEARNKILIAKTSLKDAAIWFEEEHNRAEKAEADAAMWLQHNVDNARRADKAEAKIKELLDSDALTAAYMSGKHDGRKEGEATNKRYREALERIIRKNRFAHQREETYYICMKIAEQALKE